MTPHDWPSLTPQIALAGRLFGARGYHLIGDWLQHQITRISDPKFARLFSNHIDLPGVAPADYNHRLVEARAGAVLGGIRFYGGDVSHPFVEIIAHDMSEPEALRDCVAQEWRNFTPRTFRLLFVPGALPTVDAQLDMSVHIARYCEIHRPDSQVTLAPFARVEDAVAMVDRRYADLARDNPELRRALAPAKAGDLARWHEEGHLRAICANIGGSQHEVGLFAAEPGRLEWIEGDEVHEEVILSAWSGQSFAAAAQKAWAARPDLDRERLLFGTIERQNIASRRSAERAGRMAVLNYIFVPVISPSGNDAMTAGSKC